MRGAGVYPRENRSRQEPDLRGDVSRLEEATLGATEVDCAEQLARFFPVVRAVRMPVQVTALHSSGVRLREATVVEYCGPEQAILLSTLPLGFGDRVKLECAKRGAAAEAAVIAVQYHDGRKAVAVRFVNGPCHWVMEP